MDTEDTDCATLLLGTDGHGWTLFFALENSVYSVAIRAKKTDKL